MKPEPTSNFEIDFNRVYQSGKFQGKTVREMLLSSYVVEDNGCWRWDRAFTSKGYGLFSYKDSTGQCRYFAAHRSFAKLFGMNIEEACVLHSCDNSFCVNPGHLRVGTQRDNVEDMIVRDRLNKGSCNKASKLSELQVASIRSRSKFSTTRCLADEFGVSLRSIRDIVNRKMWKHVI